MHFQNIKGGNVPTKFVAPNSNVGEIAPASYGNDNGVEYSNIPFFGNTKISEGQKGSQNGKKKSKGEKTKVDPANRFSVLQGLTEEKQTEMFDKVENKSESEEKKEECEEECVEKEDCKDECVDEAPDFGINRNLPSCVKINDVISCNSNYFLWGHSKQFHKYLKKNETFELYCPVGKNNKTMTSVAEAVVTRVKDKTKRKWTLTFVQKNDG
uniref:Uncharacterized protein n=1 Tax=Meloidogyne hapla TaxID=6305 RepID=A0A1I8B267_MELHA